MNYNFKDLKSQLIKGKVDVTIDALADIAKNELKDKSLEKELTVLHFRWEKIQREERQNVISYNQASITKNQITSAVLEVLDKIQQKTLNQNSPELKSKNTLIKYSLGVLFLLIAGTFAYLNFFKNSSTIKESSIYIECPFVDTLPFNILIFPFEGSRIDKDSREAEEALRRGLSNSTSMNELNTVARIHNKSIVIDDFNDARSKLTECKANLIIWGSIYEENDSTILRIKYVADNLTSEIIDQSKSSFVSRIKSISSLESGEVLSNFEDLFSVSVPILTSLNLVKANKPYEAIEELKKVKSSESKVNSLVLKNIGDVHLLMNDFDAAIESYEESGKDNERDAQTYNNIAFALYRKGDLQGAWDNFEKAAQIDPSNGLILDNLKLTKDEFELKYPIKEEPISLAKKNQEAETPVVVSKDEENLTTLCVSYAKCVNEGNRLASSGDYSNALKYFEAAIEYNNSRASPYIGIGGVHTNQNNYQKALLAYTKAIEVEPEFANTYFELGNTYKRMGDEENATKYYDLFVAKGGEMTTKRVNK